MSDQQQRLDALLDAIDGYHSLDERQQRSVRVELGNTIARFRSLSAGSNSLHGYLAELRCGQRVGLN